MRKFLIRLIFSAVCLVSCEMVDMPVYDNPFVYISTSGGTSEEVVSSEADNVNTYYIYLSAKKLDSPLNVYYEIVTGDGLKEGVDYELVSNKSSVTFLPGIYRMPLRIKWKPNIVDDKADNSFVIRLTGNDKDFTLGFPGPDSRFSKLTLTKKNL